MFDNVYFYYPIYGSCSCGKILELVSKYTSIVSDVNCICKTNIIDEIDIYTLKKKYISYEEYLEASKIKDITDFPKDFIKVLGMEKIVLTPDPDLHVYMICFVNVLDIKQTAPNTFDVGISYFFFHSYSINKYNKYFEELLINTHVDINSLIVDEGYLEKFMDVGEYEFVSEIKINKHLHEYSLFF